MNADLSPVADLARYSPAVQAKCISIATAIDAVDSDPANHASTRAARVQRTLQEQSGIHIGQRQIYRYLAGYRVKGVAGLADARKTRSSRGSRTDPRLIELIEAELKAQLPASTGTRSRTIARVQWEASRHDIAIPSRRTMYRLLEQLDRKRGTFGPATTRRSKAARPDRTFHPAAPSRPGELVEIDATPLDLFVQMPDGEIARPELTYAIDVATGTIGATLLHESYAKSVDIGAILLTRMLTRTSDQSWWPEAISMAERLFEPAAEPTRRILEEAAAQLPLIVPESVTVDRGKVFIGSTFAAACERLEISQTRANPRQGTDKPHVESGFKRIREGFVQYLSGYTGGTISNRGEDPRADTVWTLGEVQLLLDLWVILHWQTTPQSGLRLPGMPLRNLSPNQMYSALSVTAPHVPVSLSRDDYIALLPLTWRTVQPYGINLGGLIYDADLLHPMRGRRSGLAGEARGRWEVRYDPYNLRQVWVRDLHNERWITASWALANKTEHPFSHEVLRAAQRAIRQSGPSTSIDILEQINRIQSQRVSRRAPATQSRRRSRRSRPAVGEAAPVLELLVVPTPSRPEVSGQQELAAPAKLPTARLEILD